MELNSKLANKSVRLPAIRSKRMRQLQRQMSLARTRSPTSYGHLTLMMVMHRRTRSPGWVSISLMPQARVMHSPANSMTSLSSCLASAPKRTV
jgi:hypothetical protein